MLLLIKIEQIVVLMRRVLVHAPVNIRSFRVSWGEIYLLSIRRLLFHFRAHVSKLDDAEINPDFPTRKYSIFPQMKYTTSCHTILVSFLSDISIANSSTSSMFKMKCNYSSNCIDSFFACFCYSWHYSKKREIYLKTIFSPSFTYAKTTMYYLI